VPVAATEMDLINLPHRNYPLAINRRTLVVDCLLIVNLPAFSTKFNHSFFAALTPEFQKEYNARRILCFLGQGQIVATIFTILTIITVHHKNCITYVAGGCGQKLLVGLVKIN